MSHEIGKGSFATVWKALEKSTGKWRAVKIINKLKFAGNEKTALMLKREVDIMAEVDHVRDCVAPTWNGVNGRPTRRMLYLSPVLGGC